MTVQQLVNDAVVSLGENTVIRRFVRWELGESTQDSAMQSQPFGWLFFSNCMSTRLPKKLSDLVFDESNKRQILRTQGNTRVTVGQVKSASPVVRVRTDIFMDIV